MRLNLLVALSLMQLTACADSTLQVEAAGDLQAEMTENAIPTYTLCHGLGEIAYNVMLVRQTGVRMSDILALGENHESIKKYYDIYEGIVALAYEVPQRRTEEDRVRAAVEFRDEMELACLMFDD